MPRTAVMPRPAGTRRAREGRAGPALPRCRASGEEGPQGAQQALLEALRSEVGLVAYPGALGPCIPLGPRAQQATHRFGDLPAIPDVGGQSGFRRVHDLAARVQHAHQTGSAGPHRLDVDQSESLASTRKREAPTPGEKLPLLRLGHPSPETHPPPEASRRDLPREALSQLAITGDPELGVRGPFQDERPRVDDLPMPLVVFARTQPT